MSLAIYIGLAFAVIGSLVWIVALALFPAPIVEDEEPHGDASMLGRDRE
jgi:hypothetical protein